ncbi:gliding motility-associated C-terminal domain-containing protein [Flavobacterium fluvii]|uniref:Gliding motility-associated C-terminal domain-containing protein n=1 Tax=Flavobacterium fluvii TaxID=468056 RepID=A0A1M5J7R1_9FLAO|nr:T9SS type B sorting domain-containing protein [Flavobacterium fluvii]SHG36063.1 gliding motility-associated C-terminal domain-containing protein [Flavobacterium fluvii]
MKNILKTFICLFFNIILFNSNSYATTSLDVVSVLAPNPPTVTSPVKICQYSQTVPLDATPLPGHTLLWYGTNSTGGTGSSIAPTPDTRTDGTFTYYVSQTDGTTESTRTPIVVNIITYTGVGIYIPNVQCNYSKITTGPNAVPPTPLSSIVFDWSFNNTLPNSIIYSYSYLIRDTKQEIVASIGGTTTDKQLEIFGFSPKYSITLFLGLASYPCITQRTGNSCSPCDFSRQKPDFSTVDPICHGSTEVPALLNTSPNGITGTWTPARINTSGTGTFEYKFDPDPMTFPCADSQILKIEIVPKEIPIFNSIPTSVCQGATAPLLPLRSENKISISGTWSPNRIDTSTAGTTFYTFTPDNTDQCALTTPKTTIAITVNPILTDAGFTPIAPICIGSTAPILNRISPLGLKGTWSPAQINTNSTGTLTYTFTPDANQCAIPQTLAVTVIAKKVPNFAQIPPFCPGDPVPILASTSPNNVSGTWFPAVVNNSVSATYVFTPSANECATKQAMDIKVNEPIHPDFSNFSICSGNSAPNLDTSSPNGITGIWNPGTVDNLNGALYTFTPDPGQCAIPQTIDVTILSSKKLVDFNWEVTEAFSKNQKITIAPIAPGNDYLYQLNDGPFQKSPVFENVTSGYHSVTVQDVTGCGNSITKNNILIIDFPRFFTPNSDGYNDTWNVFELKDQLSSKIYIYDRYGKILKNISPKGAGWDGTYKGLLMPATDYWFTVEYEEQGITKKFKSHFSLKR